ncbi:MAG: hypothetical protein ACOYT8_05595 [Candidatus Dependentiae bacterium]
MNYGRGIFYGFVFFIITLCLIKNFTYTRYVALESQNRFNKELSRGDLAVTFFYYDDRCSKKDRCVRQALSQLKNIVRDVSQVSEYKEAGIGFIVINSATDNSWYYDYNLSKEPTIILFKNGVPLDQRLTGEFSYSELRSFIDENFGSDIDQAIKDNREERRLRAQEAAAYWTPYWGYYGWPYYWNTPYWGGCGGGVYFGVGCGY